MPTLIASPTRVTAAGNKPKLIDEYVGRVNSATEAVSVAHMRSPQGWVEPGQRPEFDEFTLVLRGRLHVKHEGGELDVRAGPGRRRARRRVGPVQHAGRRRRGVRRGLLPAFSPATVHRDDV
jgi:hypothetical protein